MSNHNLNNTKEGKTILTPIELIGKRVSLLPLNESHIPGLTQAASQEEIWTHMLVSGVGEDAMSSFVHSALDNQLQEREVPFTVFDRYENRIVGSTRLLNISVTNQTLEIGWTWYTPEVWRTRVNTECKYLLLQYCFETLGFKRVQFKTDLRNYRSRTALIRLGAKKEGILRKDMIRPDGTERDSVVFSIIYTEWADIKTKLANILNADQ